MCPQAKKRTSSLRFLYVLMRVSNIFFWHLLEVSTWWRTQRRCVIKVNGRWTWNSEVQQQFAKTRGKFTAQGKRRCNQITHKNHQGKNVKWRSQEEKVLGKGYCIQITSFIISRLLTLLLATNLITIISICPKHPGLVVLILVVVVVFNVDINIYIVVDFDFNVKKIVPSPILYQ